MAYYLSMPQVDALQLGRALGAPSGIYVRSRGPASDAESAVTASLRAMPPQVRWVRVQTLQERLDPQARSWTLGATMFSVFGLLALALAAVGLYSVLAFDVAQRTRELGIRSALGAERARLLRSVLYQGGRLAILGVAVGLAVAYVAAPRVQDLLFQVSPRDPGVLGAVALTLLAVGLAVAYVAAPYAQDLLFHVSPRDPTVLTTVALTLLAVSIAASLVPGIRATRVDPVAALRME
jgi:ABC-type lipoprotein release transport system permease subunit